MVCESERLERGTKNTWPCISRIKTHMSSQSLRQHAVACTGLQQVLGTYIIYELVGLSMFLVLSLVLVQFQSYYILF